MPTAGGRQNAITRGKEIGCEAVQIFTASPRQWRSAPITAEQQDAFLTASTECDISSLLAHDSYLINLAAPVDSEISLKSRAAFREEIERAETLKLAYLVSHPGSHTGDGEEAGLARLIESLDWIHKETAGAKVKVAVEITAGQGSYLGGRFEHIRRILDGVRDPGRLSVCFDTCHAFVAGYDLRDEESYAQTMAEFDKVVGLKNIGVIHANDSQKGLGSHADRHAHIGEGEIGLEAFRLLVNDPRFADLPIIVETPEAETMHEVNVKRLKDLRSKPPQPNA